MKTEKQIISEKLKENGIIGKVTITKNRIDVKYKIDMIKASKLFPNMGIVYGFYK